MLSFRCSYRLIRFLSSSKLNDVDIGAKMKSFNDQQQYQKSVELFEKNRNKSLTSLTISQALKALIHLKKYEQARILHHQLSSVELNNNFIRTNLIRLYCNEKRIFFR